LNWYSCRRPCRSWCRPRGKTDDGRSSRASSSRARAPDMSRTQAPTSSPVGAARLQDKRGRPLWAAGAVVDVAGGRATGLLWARGQRDTCWGAAWGGALAVATCVGLLRRPTLLLIMATCAAARRSSLAASRP
jgi:hypothetical protein